MPATASVDRAQMSARAQQHAFRIGEVAERVGVTTRTIRYYEELGLLGSSPGRAKGAHRLYTDADVARLQEVIRLRDLLGLALDELVVLVEAEETRAVLCDEWQADPDHEHRLRIVEAAIPLVERQLALLRARQDTLTEFAGELREKLGLLEEKRRELGAAIRL